MKFFLAEWRLRGFFCEYIFYRAVYSERDVVLLDDPLSAVDAHVGKHIFFECIKKELAGRTILFVTHQLQYLKDCDEVIMLSEGVVAEQGKHEHLMQRKGDYAELIKYISMNFGLHSRPLCKLEQLTLCPLNLQKGFFALQRRKNLQV